MASSAQSRSTDLTEKTPISTNLRTVGLAVAGVAVAVWYGANWMSTVTNKLDTHSTAIQEINGQLSELRSAQEANLEKILGAIERRPQAAPTRYSYPSSEPANAPAEVKPGPSS